MEQSRDQIEKSEEGLHASPTSSAKSSKDEKVPCLLDQVIALTGLPEEALRKEMSRALADLEQSPEDLDLEKLRALLANYVQDVLVELKDSFENET